MFKLVILIYWYLKMFRGIFFWLIKLWYLSKIRIIIYREKVEGGYNIKFIYIVIMKIIIDDMMIFSIVICIIVFW